MYIWIKFLTIDLKLLNRCTLEDVFYVRTSCVSCVFIRQVYLHLFHGLSVTGETSKALGLQFCWRMTAQDIQFTHVTYWLNSVWIMQYSHFFYIISHCQLVSFHGRWKSVWNFKSSLYPSCTGGKCNMLPIMHWGHVFSATLNALKASI